MSGPSINPPHAAARPPENPYGIVFPGASQSPEAGETPALAIADARPLVSALFEDASNLWHFEAGLRQPGNLSTPNRFTHENWFLVQLLKGQDAEWGETPMFEDPVLEEALGAISPEADLFGDWRAVEAPVVRILHHLMHGYGFTVLAATGMLYQKRPGLVPILDRFTRLACRVPVPDRWSPEALGSAIGAFRAVARLSANSAALGRLVSYFSERPALTSHLALSRMRLLNLVASRAVQSVGAPAEEPPAGRRHPGRRRPPAP